VFPAVARKLACTFRVVGRAHEGLRRRASASVEFAGFVPDLEPEYNRHRIFVVPNQFSAGVPLKLIEAMSRGIPAVVSELTARQLGLVDGEAVLIGRTPEEYAHKIASLYGDAALWQRVAGQRASLRRRALRSGEAQGCAARPACSAGDSQELIDFASGTNTDTRGSGPTSRVACPCPVKSSAIKMSPGLSRRTVPSPISMSNLYCYEGQVDAIYIDPPYNSGARVEWLPTHRRVHVRSHIRAVDHAHECRSGSAPGGQTELKRPSGEAT
jgi:16S rRNA G966 N2-methylase RsmD